MRHSRALRGVTVAHPPAVQERVEPFGHVLGDAAGSPSVREPSKSEWRTVPRGDDVHSEARTPHLQERGVFPRRRSYVLDACVDREERSARDAVLQPGPRGDAQRPHSEGQPLFERSRAAAVREDLFTREDELGVRGAERRG